MKNVFEIRDLAVSFDSKKVLADINIDIRKNKITAIVGPSGCGKSTLLKILNDLIEYEDHSSVSGNVNYLGRNIVTDQSNKQEHRKEVAMLFQNPGAFPFSVKKNLDIAFEEWHRRDEELQLSLYRKLLTKVALWKEIDGDLSVRANNLSGGQQQRLCLIRSLLTDPSVILLDEPCSALDPISTRIIENYLIELKEDKTIIIVTHDLSQAKRIADDIVVMWPIAGIGQVVENGCAETIFTEADTYIAKEYLEGRIPDIA